MNIRAKLFVVAMCALLSTAAFAAMNGPTGLALDSKGNLYVANFGSNQIQVYATTHKQVKNKTITQGVSGPLSIAIDSQDQLWVANYSSNIVWVYSAGRPLTNYSNGVFSPTAIAVDPAGTIYLVDAASTLNIYDPFFNIVNALSYDQVEPGSSALYGVAASRTGAVAFGSNAAYSLTYAADVVGQSHTDYLGRIPVDGGRAIAFAGNDFYIGLGNGTIMKNSKSLMTLPYIPSGMAVDGVRGYVYLSNNSANSVDMYSVTGAYIGTIH